MRKYDFSAEDANTVNSIIYIISAVASPVFGLVIDKFGRNVMWVFLSVSVTIGAHSILAFTFINPYVGMVRDLTNRWWICLTKIYFIYRRQVIMGLAYSMLASSLWPLVALIIPEYQLGTAYGM